MKLVEVVPAIQTDADVVDACMKQMEYWQKLQLRQKRSKLYCQQSGQPIMEKPSE